MDCDGYGLCRYEPPSSNELATMCRQMLSALAHIHELSVAHRDIKPANWLIDGKSFAPVLKLTDFGLAADFIPGQPLQDTCGSFLYMAPEVFQGSYTELCDLWSLGLVCHEMVWGKPLFAKLSESCVRARVCEGSLSFDEPWCCKWLKALVRQLLLKEVEGRPSALQALENPKLQPKGCLCSVS